MPSIRNPKATYCRFTMLTVVDAGECLTILKGELQGGLAQYSRAWNKASSRQGRDTCCTQKGLTV